MSGPTLAPELARRLAIAHENVKVAEQDVELALKAIEAADRADKRIITTALRTAFDKLAVARRELEAVLNPG